MDELVLSYEPGGTHRIAVTFGAGDVIPFLIVRPVGTLELDTSGAFRHGVFAPEWVPQFVAALQLAQRIANREKSWERYEDEPWLYGPFGPEPHSGADRG